MRLLEITRLVPSTSSFHSIFNRIVLLLKLPRKSFHREMISSHREKRNILSVTKLHRRWGSLAFTVAIVIRNNAMKLWTDSPKLIIRAYREYFWMTSWWYFPSFRIVFNRFYFLSTFKLAGQINVHLERINNIIYLQKSGNDTNKTPTWRGYTNNTDNILYLLCENHVSL